MGLVQTCPTACDNMFSEGLAVMMSHHQLSCQLWLHTFSQCQQVSAADFVQLVFCFSYSLCLFAKLILTSDKSVYFALTDQVASQSH